MPLRLPPEVPPRPRPRAPRRATMAFVVAAFALGLASACTMPHTVRTVGKGHTAVNVGFGGPLVHNIGGAVPAPDVTVGAQHGLTDAWDVHGSFHLLPAVFKNLGLDVGVTRRLLVQKGGAPEWTATLRLNVLTNFEAFRIYPELESYVSWRVRRRWLLYAGMTTFYDFFWVKEHHFRMHWGPVLGFEVRLGRRHALGLALKWISPQVNSEEQAVSYVAPGRLGLVFVQIGYRVSFRGWKEP